MVLIICTKNKSNLTNRYRDMVPDRQKVRTDDAKTISLRLCQGRGITSKNRIDLLLIPLEFANVPIEMK